MSDKLIADATQVPDTTIFALNQQTILRWTAIAPGSMKTAAILGDAVGGGSCLLGAGGKALGTGQFGTVKVNVYLANNQNMIATMQDATKAIRDAFVAANSCMPNTVCSLPAGAKDAGLMDGR